MSSTKIQSPSISLLDQAFHSVFRCSYLVMKIMKDVEDIHSTLGYIYLEHCGIGDSTPKENEKVMTKGIYVAKGKELISHNTLYTFIRFGLTEWFMDVYDKICSSEGEYPFSYTLLEAAIRYKNTDIVDKLLLNPNMVKRYGLWTNEMLAFGFHKGLIEKYEMDTPIDHDRLIYALSSGSLELIQFLFDNNMVIECTKREKYETIFYDKSDFGSKWILKPSMFDMISLIIQHGFCTDQVHATLLKLAYINKVPIQLFELICQHIQLPNDIMDIVEQNNSLEIMVRSYPWYLRHNIQGYDVIHDKKSKDELIMIRQENLARLVLENLMNYQSDQLIKFTSLKEGDWFRIFILALRCGNNELLQMAYRKCGEIDWYILSRNGYMVIHSSLLKQEVYSLLGISVCCPLVMASALIHDREYIIQEALNNDDHDKMQCKCFKQKYTSCYSMLFEAIKRGRRSIIDWSHRYHLKINPSIITCACRNNILFEKSLQLGDMKMVKIFVKRLSNNIGPSCGSSYDFVNGSAKYLSRLGKHYLGYVSIRNLISATQVKDTSVTENMIIKLLEGGNFVRYNKNYDFIDIHNAYRYGLMKLVKILVKGYGYLIEKISITYGLIPYINSRSVRYFIKSYSKEDRNEFDKNRFFGDLLNRIDQTCYDDHQYQKRGLNVLNHLFPRHLQKIERSKLKRKYKSVIRLIYFFNQIKKPIKLEHSISTLVEYHFDLIPLMLRECDDEIWQSTLMTSKDKFITDIFELKKHFRQEVWQFFWTYMNELDASDPLRNSIFMLYHFKSMESVISNQPQYFSNLFYHPQSPWYYKQDFRCNNNGITLISMKLKLKIIKKESFEHGNYSIINMCNTIIDHLNSY